MNTSGLCMCGCGERTALAAQTNTRRGHIRGRPVNYVAGHTGRAQVRKGPPGMRWCGDCGAFQPESEFYTAGRTRADGAPYLRPYCKSHDKARRNDAAYYRAYRARIKAEDPERYEAWCAMHRERRRAARQDPERHAILMAQQREYRTGSPVRDADGRPSALMLVPAAPVLEAVARSGVTPADISRRLGQDVSSVGKALQRAEAAGHMQTGVASRILAAIDVLPVEVGL